MGATSKIRRQGGAAIVTIPPALLQQMHAEVGSQLELDVSDGTLVARLLNRAVHKRYSLRELLKGSARMAALNNLTAAAREGDPIGRELA